MTHHTNVNLVHGAQRHGSCATPDEALPPSRNLHNSRFHLRSCLTCTKIPAMRNERTNIFETIKDAVLGYAVLILSFLVFCIVLWAIIVAVRVIFLGMGISG